MRKGRFLVFVGILVVIQVLLGVTMFAMTSNATSIIRATQDWPVYIDPAVGNKFSDSICLVNLYDSLVFPTPTGGVKPDLATNWKVSSDGLVYTFYLRHGVKFHSGDEVTAEDVVFSANRLLTIGQGFAYVFAPYIKSVKALDKYTVQFTLKRKFGPFISALVRLYVADKKVVMKHMQKKGAYGNFGDFGTTWLMTHDAGSGPYMVDDVNLESYVLMKKFNDWWGGWEKYAPEYFKLMGTTQPVTVRTMMANHKLEITDELQPLENYKAMAKIPGVKVVAYLDGNNFNGMLNTKKAPTDDIHFRRALAYAVDYNTIVKYIYPACKRSAGPVPQALAGHDPSIKPWPFDMKKAEEELKKSKYYGQLDKYPITLDWCAEAPRERKVALLMASNWEKLGIKVIITKKPFATMMADAEHIDTTPNVALIFVAPDYDEAGSMLYVRYSLATLGTWEQGEWLKDSKINDMILDALGTTNRKERFEKYYKIQEALVKLCPTIWLFDEAQMRAYQASYVYWPTAERVKLHEPVTCVMGYNEYVHDMKVYPH
jgi:peptide/nickel transport system substrate-binding protein